MNLKKTLMQIIDWTSGDYEKRLRSPLRALLFFLEFSAWFYLIFWMAFSVEFNQKRDCIQFQPLIEHVKSGKYIVLNYEEYKAQQTGNFSITPIDWQRLMNFSQSASPSPQTIP